MENASLQVDAILKGLKGLPVPQASALLREALERVERTPVADPLPPAPAPEPEVLVPRPVAAPVVAAPVVAPIAPAPTSAAPISRALDSEATANLRRAVARSRWIIAGAVAISLLIISGTAYFVFVHESGPELTADDAPPAGRRVPQPPMAARAPMADDDDIAALPTPAATPRHRPVAKAAPAPRAEPAPRAAPVAAHNEPAPRHNAAATAAPTPTPAAAKPAGNEMPEQYVDEDLKHL